MPYRIDFAHADQAALLRILDLGPLDVDVRANEGGAAIMPDGVAPAEVARALGVPHVDVSATPGRDADSVWVLAPRVVGIGRVRLVPAAAVLPLEVGDVRLIDTPAFGTGLHATTTLCVALIDELLETMRVETMLDVGTGSGVLALAALTLGVPRAVAIDIDGPAAQTTLRNARVNALHSRMHVVQATIDALAGRWPLVVANVLAAPLVDMAPALARRVGHEGRLMLSGIPLAVQPDVERAYRRVGMHLTEVRTREGWVAMSLRASW